MKRLIVLLGPLCWAGLCAAQEEGLVISSTPLVRQVAVPRRVCTSEPVSVQPPKSGTGATIGAIAGGIVGNAATNGSAAATVLGAIGGAMVGDRLEEAPAAQVQYAQHCSMQTFHENRTVGYAVEYEYGGKRYKVELPYDPGQTIALRVAPADLGEPGAPPPQVVIPTPVYTSVVVAPSPVYYHGAPYPYPYYYNPYPRVGIHLRLGGYPHHHHWHRHHPHHRR